MALSSAFQGRRTLYFLITGMVLMAAAVMAVSTRDGSGTGLRAGMIMLTAGAALILPWRYAIVATLALWLGPNYVRSLSDGDSTLFGTTMLLELPGLLGLTAFAAAVQLAVNAVEEARMASDLDGRIDPETGLYEEAALRQAIESELSRSQRFNHSFALVLIGIDDKHQRFAFRDEAEWNASFLATARLLRRTRNNIDRVFLRGSAGFALILPESGEKEVAGLVKRLRKLANNSKPREGEPGGPLPVSFGATFFPTSASTVEDLLRRAEVALRLSSKSGARLQLDGAAAPEMAPPETLRHERKTEAPLPVAAQPMAVQPIAASENVIEPQVARPVDKPAPPPALAVVTPITVPTATTMTRPEASAMPPSLAASQPAAPAIADSPAAMPQMSDEELAQLLGRLDETLGLIRGLRSQAS